MYDDYRKLLDRKDIEVVTIVTPDHWHTKIAIDAMRAGKDVYCEKPLTLTIDEGKQICKVLKETNRVFQVGTQQRSEMNQRVPQGHRHDPRRPHRQSAARQPAPSAARRPADRSTPMPIPPELNWEMWLGQAPLVDYTEKRCHYEFRWWYEYSGGKMTDWGAHHVDIATWGIGTDIAGPFRSKGPPSIPTFPTATTRPPSFSSPASTPTAPKSMIRHDTENGVTFEGDKGTIFVSRGEMTGKPVEELKDHPLPEDAIEKLYGGKPTSHMANFFECVEVAQAADLRRLHAPPFDHDLPPGEHRHSPGSKDQMGPAGRADRRRFRGPKLASPRPAQGLRDRRLKRAPSAAYAVPTLLST